MIIDRIRISNFRGIKESEVESLKRVNVFFGKNNCGKSSLLESVFLLSGLSNPLLPIRINQFREYANLRDEDLNLNFYNLQTSEPISIQGFKDGESRRELKITKFTSRSKTIDISKLTDQNSNDIANLFYGYKLSFTVDGSNPYNAEFVLSENDSESKENEKNVTAKINQDKRYTEQVTAKILLPNSTFQSNFDSLKNMITNKQADQLVEALSMVDSRIKSIDIVEKDVMVDIGLPSLLPINVMGDGVRKLLSIIVSINECKDGILIIDEIDNGLHFSTMKNLWRSIFTQTKRNNVQMFISTHNIDLIRELTSVLSEEEYADHQSEVISHKLLHTEDGTLHALAYDYEKLSFAIEQEIEPR